MNKKINTFLLVATVAISASQQDNNNREGGNPFTRNPYLTAAGIAGATGLGYIGYQAATNPEFISRTAERLTTQGARASAYGISSWFSSLFNRMPTIHLSDYLSPKVIIGTLFGLGTTATGYVWYKRRKQPKSHVRDHKSRNITPYKDCIYNNARILEYKDREDGIYRVTLHKNGVIYVYNCKNKDENRKNIQLNELPEDIRSYVRLNS